MMLEVLPDKEALAERAVEFIADVAAQSIEERGIFTFAVSGGSTPRRMLELLAERPGIDWGRVHLFQVDERVAPDGDPDRNATMLDEALLTEEFRSRHTLGGVWLLPVTADDLDTAAAQYAADADRVTGSPIVFDLVQLGLGDDGHTASLVPDDPILEVDDRDVAVTAEYKGRQRLSLTWPAIDRAKHQLWVIAGASKGPALAQYLNADPAIPASLPTQARATVLVDEDAFNGA